MAELRAEIEKYDSKMEDLHTENLYLESYSRRENIKFMNINEEPSTNGNENTVDILRNFLERDLGFLDARSVEIQRVHRIGMRREDKPRPILARFLRYKDCQKILSLGHRLQGTNHQMFRDLPNEIINGRKKQLETLKVARKNGIPAAFSASEPDKLFIRGKLWPVGQELIPS